VTTRNDPGLDRDDDLETERYELREVLVDSPADGTTRREFLKVLGGGLVVVLITREALAAPHIPGTVPPEDTASQQQRAEAIAAWLHIAGDSSITIYTGKVEFGQGIRTSLAQMVAEELHVPVSSVRLVMGDTDLTPFDQGTFGSRSTPQMGTQLRQAASAARAVLIGLAAERWSVSPDALAARDGKVSDGRGRSVAYGELTAGRKLTETVRTDAALRPASQWTVAGIDRAKVDAHAMVTGRHRFTSDMRVAGMVHGKILRPPAIGSRLATLDDARARAIPGVTVVRHDDSVGVTAATPHDAERALAALRATWTPASGAQTSSATLRTQLKRETGGGRGGGSAPSVRGDVDIALAAADHRLTRSYDIAYIAHVPMETRAAVAQWTRDTDGEKLTVWTGTQRPWGVRDELAAAFGVPAERVRVIVPDTGAGYGGKHTGDAAVEAARLARVAGKPVRVVWTREEEFRWAYFRPAGVIDVTAGVRADGTITAWTFDNYNSGTAGIRPMYAIPNQRVTFHPSNSPLRQGSYRALASTANHFAREVHIDELATMAKMDALAFRLKNLEDPRLRAAFEAAAERFGWGRPVPAGHGVGIAGGFEKGGYVATCVEVAVDRATGKVQLVRIVTSFDCGAIVNPDGLRNQVVGSLIQGIGGALFEAISFDSGVIRNARLTQYRVPRFSDVPPIDIVLIDRKDQPSMGSGEAPIIALAPAVSAAIFQATGVRPRALPMAPNGISASSAAR
jgi:isoquinoline 1-oxidoreductase